MSDVMGKADDNKMWPPTVDGIPINELPITYGRLDGPSWEVKIALAAYLREMDEKDEEVRYMEYEK